MAHVRVGMQILIPCDWLEIIQDWPKDLIGTVRKGINDYAIDGKDTVTDRLSREQMQLITDLTELTELEDREAAIERLNNILAAQSFWTTIAKPFYDRQKPSKEQ